MFNKNVFTQKDPIADLIKPMLEAQTKAKMEELKGNQAVLDKNKNNKLDAQDFKILRGEKKAVKEDAEQVEEGLKDIAKKAVKALTGGSDEDQLKNLQKKMGVPQTGKKPVKEEEELEESSPFDWKKPREPEVKGGAGVKKGRAYGGAAQKSKPEQDDADDKKKVKEDVEQIDELSKSTVKSYIKKKHDDMYKTGAPPSMAHVKKTMTNLQRAHDRNTGVKPTSEEVEQVEERTLTKGETAERERIVKGMKKGLAGFKARYGDRAKSVMYATATKAAKKD